MKMKTIITFTIIGSARIKIVHRMGAKHCFVEKKLEMYPHPHI